MSVLPPTRSFTPAGSAIGPESIDELSDLVREAAARGQPLSIEGNGSKRHLGPAVTGEVRRVSVHRLTGVTAYDPADMVVSVRAGMRLRELQKVLGAHGQWLPVDPPYPAATVGGVLASGSVGPRRLGYGTLRDAVLGMKIVAADGALTSSGGRVVKNVSGYDLHRLQIGAFGTLGVLAELHFKLSVRPAAVAVVLVPQPSFAAAQAALLGLPAGLQPVALEALDAVAAAALDDGEVARHALAVIGVEGSRALVEHHLKGLAKHFGDDVLVREGADAERTWAAHGSLAAQTEAISLRVGARPHRLPELLQALRLDGDGDLPVRALRSQVGTGVAHVDLERVPDLEALGRQLVALDARARVEHGGYVVVESAPVGLSGREALPFGGFGALARRVKDAFDPSGVLNPGRVRF